MKADCAGYFQTYGESQSVAHYKKLSLLHCLPWHHKLHFSVGSDYLATG